MELRLIHNACILVSDSRRLNPGCQKPHRFHAAFDSLFRNLNPCPLFATGVLWVLVISAVLRNFRAST